MFNYRFGLIILGLLLGCKISAQNQVQLSIGNVASVDGETVCIPIIADSFPRIVSAQFSISWDPSIVAFSNVELGENPLELTNANNIFTPNDSVINFSWFDLTGAGKTLEPGTSIAELCLSPLTSSGSTILDFNGGIDALPPEFIQEGILISFPHTTINGSFTINPVLQTVLPGDANNDSIVNLLDVLNIGLGYGQTGVPRNNTSTAFIPQDAAEWTNSTPMSNVNYCHANTDGNNVINDADIDVVSANYGQRLVEPTEVVIQDGLQFLYTVSEAPIYGGETAEIHILTGNDTEPQGRSYGIAFNVKMDTTLFDINNAIVSFEGSFLGQDLLTYSSISATDPEVLEIVAVRKDGVNTNMISGRICSINITSINTAEAIETEWLITPIRFIDAQENNIQLSPATSEVVIETPVSTQEPAWSEQLTVSPNPVIGNTINISGLTNEVANIQLRNIQGQLLTSYAAMNGQLFLDKSLAAGTYFLQFISTNGSVVTRKIMFQ